MEKCWLELYALGQGGGLPFLKVLPLQSCFLSPSITKYPHSYKAAPLFEKQMRSQKTFSSVSFATPFVLHNNSSILRTQKLENLS